MGEVTRDAGFYWVRRHDDRSNGRWEPAEYRSDQFLTGWELLGDNRTPYRDDDLAEIGQQIAPPPVVEEGRREAAIGAAYLAIYGEGMDPLEHPEGWEYAATIADAILALTPVEGVGDDDLLKRSASAEQAYANMHPENAAMIASIIDGYRFDTPSDRARAHEVARAMAGHPRDTPVAAQGDEVREALEHEPRPRSDGMLDFCGCSCGWEGETYFDGSVYAKEAWERHRSGALATLGAPREG